MSELVSVVIVNWNGEKYLYKCINSLLKQSYKNIEIIFIDNASTDNSLKIVEEHFFNKVKIIKNKNTGYAGGSNKGIELSKGSYVMIANPDVVFGEKYISTCIAKFKDNEKYGAITGKLLKYDFELDKKLNIIDSVGIAFNHNRKGIDIGQNEEDIGRYENDKRVFGVSGAAAIFKKSVLDKVAINGEIFDNDFFAYKEDIDLCWRINLYGYQCVYVHKAIAYHGRAMNSSKGIISTIKNRKNQSELLKGISFRNHYLMMIKNETEHTYSKDKFRIYKGIAAYLIFFLLFDFKCLKYIKEIKKKKNTMLEKRKIIRKNKLLSDNEIYKLFDL